MNGLALCAGVGGIDLGLGLAIDGYRTVCYVEREGHAAATLVAGMEASALDRAPVWDDIKTFDGRAWRGIVDIVHAGWPCQPFSFAGKRQGEADERHLWPDVSRILGEVRPRAFFGENVAGHLSLGFEEVVPDLERLGYRVACGLFTASEVGAPHKRERLFVLADAEQPDVQVPPPGGADGTRRRAPACTGRELADADRGQREQQRGESECGGGSPFRPFPPGPGEDWSGIPRDLWPALPQPEIRGMAHGASRVDLLRAFGNGVVPVVAAYAYITLAAALEQSVAKQGGLF